MKDALILKKVGPEKYVIEHQDEKLLPRGEFDRRIGGWRISSFNYPMVDVDVNTFWLRGRDVSCDNQTFLVSEEREDSLLSAVATLNKQLREKAQPADTVPTPEGSKVDPNEAPEGFIAIPKKPCSFCALFGNRCNELTGVSCLGRKRKDGMNVCFVVKTSAEPAKAEPTPMLEAERQLQNIRNALEEQKMHLAGYEDERRIAVQHTALATKRATLVTAEIAALEAMLAKLEPKKKGRKA